MSLEALTEAWVTPFENGRHLIRTRDWLLELDRSAGEALRIAALTHDVERNFPDAPVQPANLPANDRTYPETTAPNAGSWVRDGRYTRERTEEQLRWMLDRIRLPEARRLALPFYDSGVSGLGSGR